MEGTAWPMAGIRHDHSFPKKSVPKDSQATMRAPTFHRQLYTFANRYVSG